MARYLIVDIAYYPDRYNDGSHWEPTPKWFGESFPSDLTITDDTERGEEYEDMPDIATRKFVGIVTEKVWDRLASDWDMTEDDSEPNMGILTEFGFMPSDSWTHDGMDWNMGGISMIAFVDVRVSPRYTFG